MSLPTRPIITIAMACIAVFLIGQPSADQQIWLNGAGRYSALPASRKRNT